MFVFLDSEDNDLAISYQNKIVLLHASFLQLSNPCNSKNLVNTSKLVDIEEEFAIPIALRQSLTRFIRYKFMT